MEWKKLLDTTIIETLEASAVTHAATGIHHFVVHDDGWRALGANDAEIASIVTSKAAGSKGVLRLDTHDSRIEITYSIEVGSSCVVIDAVVNGIPSKVAFSKDGELIGEGLKTTIDPAIYEMFQLISNDTRDLQRRHRRDVPEFYRCLGLLDAMDGAWRAHEFLAWFLLEVEFDFCRG